MVVVWILYYIQIILFRRSSGGISIYRVILFRDLYRFSMLNSILFACSRRFRTLQLLVSNPSRHVPDPQTNLDRSNPLAVVHSPIHDRRLPAPVRSIQRPCAWCRPPYHAGSRLLVSRELVFLSFPISHEFLTRGDAWWYDTSRAGQCTLVPSTARCIAAR